MTPRFQWSPGPAAWQDDVSPLPPSEWNYDRAAHLLAHAGFGGTPEEIEKLADAGLERAVESLVRYERLPNPKMQPFVESGLWDPTLDRFPESRPDATDRAEKYGASMGVDVKPASSWFRFAAGGQRKEVPTWGEAESDRSGCWHRRTLHLRPQGRRRSWLLRWRREVEFGVGGEPLGLLGAALPAAEAVGFLDPVGRRLNGDANAFVFREGQRLGRLEDAVLVNGFDGQGHGYGSKG